MQLVQWFTQSASVLAAHPPIFWLQPLFPQHHLFHILNEDKWEQNPSLDSFIDLRASETARQHFFTARFYYGCRTGLLHKS